MQYSRAEMYFQVVFRVSASYYTTKISIIRFFSLASIPWGFSLTQKGAWNFSE